MWERNYAYALALATCDAVGAFFAPHLLGVRAEMENAPPEMRRSVAGLGDEVLLRISRRGLTQLELDSCNLFVRNR